MYKVCMCFWYLQNKRKTWKKHKCDRLFLLWHLSIYNLYIQCEWSIWIKRLGLFFVSRSMNYCELRIKERISSSNVVTSMYNIHAYIRYYIIVRIAWLSNETYLSTISRHDYVHFCVLSSLLYISEGALQLSFNHLVPMCWGWIVGEERLALGPQRHSHSGLPSQWPLCRWRVGGRMWKGERRP